MGEEEVKRDVDIDYDDEDEDMVEPQEEEEEEEEEERGEEGMWEEKFKTHTDSKPYGRLAALYLTVGFAALYLGCMECCSDHSFI